MNPLTALMIWLWWWHVGGGWMNVKMTGKQMDGEKDGSEKLGVGEQAAFS